MYSEGGLSKIAEYFRKSVEPVPLRQLSDVKRFPNPVLMSYLISDLDLGREDIKLILEDLAELEGLLKAGVPEKGHDKEQLPMLYAGVTYEDDLYYVANSIEVPTGKFARGDEDELIIANKDERVYRYPSGMEAEHFVLIDEKTANVSIFEGGYGTFSSGDVYVRQNFVSMMLAFMDAARDSPEFAEYRKQMDYFHEHVEGVLIAHERSEIEIVRAGEFPEQVVTPEEKFQRELEAEKHAQAFLKEQGVDIKAYELYHKLRAAPPEEGFGDVSRTVLARMQDAA